MLHSPRLGSAAALAAAALSLAAAAPAGAAQSSPRTASPDVTSNYTADGGSEDRLICVRAMLTGSRLVRRICRTQREWDEDGGVPNAR